MRLSEGQKKWLARLSQREECRPFKDNFKSFDKTMAALCKLGLAEPAERRNGYAYFRITSEGRAVRAAMYKDG